MNTQPRTARPELWGPLSLVDLLGRLAAEHGRACSDANRAGHHPSPAALIAWEALRQQFGPGPLDPAKPGPFNPARLPFHARAITRRVQTRTWHA
jgi:hypothetical protein